MDSTNPSEKKTFRRKFKKEHVKTKISNKLLNHIIIIFLFFILPISIVLIADSQLWVTIPDIILDFLKLVDIVLISYALATIFLKFTVNIIPNWFESVGKREEKILLSKIYIAFVYVLATVIIFWQVGISSQNIVIFLGLIATGFAFAIRDVILSYFIWFILLTKKPFKIGDYINVGEEEGQVKHIGLFYVVIYPSRHGGYYKIPNKVFLEKPIKNYGVSAFESTFDYYLEEIPKDLKTRITSVVEKAREVENINMKLVLDSDSDGLKLTAYYRSTFDERETVRHKILGMILEEMDFLKAK
ncbi:small-conductance mechanosensitive channel [Methanohalophilus levihalophilus]|uniref:mechanosensitive ion channel family protein n=1 Tax=Methanohalophilus levihalophilus TaxID=1431282 RepID=UPI001AE1BBAE|nr:mechanosensitive ion channel domain-containing protein [Methanohalophilus levihalophilus]MBP2030229.1 small-conductance mechanosensitive channel [Methanohalophilus levihalophilus]